MKQVIVTVVQPNLVLLQRKLHDLSLPRYQLWRCGIEGLVSNVGLGVSYRQCRADLNRLPNLWIPEVMLKPISPIGGGADNSLAALVTDRPDPALPSGYLG